MSPERIVQQVGVAARERGAGAGVAVREAGFGVPGLDWLALLQGALTV